MKKPRTEPNKASPPTPRNRKGALPLGPPSAGEDRSPLTSITFKATDDVLEALDLLERSLNPAVRVQRSVAIRGAILDAAAAARRELARS